LFAEYYDNLRIIWGVAPKHAVKHKNLYQLFLANSDYINNLERNKRKYPLYRIIFIFSKKNIY